MLTRGAEDVLTERIIRDAKPEAKTRILWDKTIRGLGVRVTAGGVKSFILNYRVAGKERRATLGRHPALGLRSARELAGAELAGIRAGKADPVERQRVARAAPTVADALDRFRVDYVEARLRIGRMAPRTAQTYGHQDVFYVRPALGSMRVADVRRSDVVRLVAPFPNATRNRVLAFVSRLFSLIEQWEWRPQHSNPVRGIERALEEPRDRVLGRRELAALSAALDRLDERFPASVAAIRVAALTGLRISEVLAIRWADVDFDTGRVTLTKTKTGRRVHDLPPPALGLLRAVPRVHGAAHVFVVDARGPLTYRTVRHRFSDAVKMAGLTDVRLHDLRRTVMTNAAATGVSSHVLRDLLGHKTATMADRYVRAVGSPVADARRAIGEAMADAMAGD